jgi:hypothetical protein
MVLSEEEGSPSPRRHNMGALPAPITTTPWLENTPATQATTTVPPRVSMSRSNISLPFERRCTFREGQRVRACAKELNAEHEAVQ